MNTNQQWAIIEKLADSETPSEERMQLLQQVESDPDLLNQWKAFRVLQQWPELEPLTSKQQSAEPIIDHIRQLDSVDAGIRRIFPYVAAAALGISVILALTNIEFSQDVSDITLDDVFGLPAPTIENALLANL